PDAATHWRGLGGVHIQTRGSQAGGRRRGSWVLIHRIADIPRQLLCPRLHIFGLASSGLLGRLFRQGEQFRGRSLDTPSRELVRQGDSFPATCFELTDGALRWGKRSNGCARR